MIITVKNLIEINFTDYKISMESEYSKFSHRAGSEDTSRVQRSRVRSRTGVEAEFNRFGSVLGYSYESDDYRSGARLFGPMSYQDKDKITNIVDGEISYQVQPKTTLFLQSNLGFIDYASKLSSDSTFFEAFIGAQGEFMDFYTANVKFGVKKSEL